VRRKDPPNEERKEPFKGDKEGMGRGWGLNGGQKLKSGGKFFWGGTKFRGIRLVGNSVEKKAGEIEKGKKRER